MESEYLYGAHDWATGGERKTFYSYEEAIDYLVRDYDDVYSLPFDYTRVPFDSYLAGHDLPRRLLQKQVKRGDREYSDKYGIIDVIHVVWVDR